MTGNSSHKKTESGSLKKRAVIDAERWKDRKRYHSVILFAMLLLLSLLILALSVGRYAIPFSTTVKVLFSKFIPITAAWDSKTEAVIMTLRMPRSIAAVCIGSALALSGACYQSIFRNPMVSPDLLGVSSGACVGAALAILLDMSSASVQLLSFLFGTGTVLLTISIPRLLRNDGTTVLVLSGVIMSSLMSSIMSIIKFLADTDTKLAEITYWTMGSLATVTMPDILSVLPAMILSAGVILLLRFRLNVMSLGDREAQTLGINLRRTRVIFIICSTLLTASCVCLAGTIGWVGLVIPHIARMMVGADNKRMLPAAGLFGACFMLVIDTLSRTLSSAELKLGILTGVVGAPFFFFILLRQKQSLT